jgi:hypothetical protein
LLGVGESSDAHHISAPDPEGRGAEAAMRHALQEAGLQAGAVHYINLHGTGTPHNDSMEAAAVDRVFGKVAVSSTKPLTGHCLGAAGALEVGFCWLTLGKAGKGGAPLPPHHWDDAADESMPRMNVVRRDAVLPTEGPVHLLSNSFAFGGSNCAVILGRNFSNEEPVRMPPRAFGEHTLHVRDWMGWAPGLQDQEAWRRWLPERAPLPDNASVPSCAEVPPMLRRRCGRLTRMVLEVAFGVCRSSGIDPGMVNHVHCSRFGEINALRELSEFLYREEPLSPTLFSNSVHQTPASYFDLAAKNTRISRTLSAGTEGLVCALLETCGLLQKQPETPVLVTFADEPPPEPYNIGGNFSSMPFAVALLCQAEPGGSGQTVRGSLDPAKRAGEPRLQDDSLFDFLRWLDGNKPEHDTASSFGLWTWRK